MSGAQLLRGRLHAVLDGVSADDVLQGRVLPLPDPDTLNERCKTLPGNYRRLPDCLTSLLAMLTVAEFTGRVRR